MPSGLCRFLSVFCRRGCKAALEVSPLEPIEVAGQPDSDSDGVELHADPATGASLVLQH